MKREEVCSRRGFQGESLQSLPGKRAMRKKPREENKSWDCSPERRVDLEGLQGRSPEKGLGRKEAGKQQQGVGL